MSMRLPRTPSFRLDGKRALVTGAGRSIGQAAAAALAEYGAHVLLAARTESEIQKTSEAINAQGGSAEPFVLDMTDTDAVRELCETQPVFDILIGNAGINRIGAMLDVSLDDFDAVMDINVRAAWFSAREIARGMISQGKGGSIIHISSQMGVVGGIDRTIYCASKHAIEGMTKAMAIEMAPHKIRVNTICPTFIRTPLTENTLSDPERLAWVESRIKLGRVGTVEDIMGAVLYLASPASALVTGTALLVDGGWTAG